MSAQRVSQLKKWIDGLCIGDELDAGDRLSGEWKIAKIENVKKNHDNHVQSIIIKFLAQNFTVYIDIKKYRDNPLEILKKINKVHTVTPRHANNKCVHLINNSHHRDGSFNCIFCSLLYCLSCSLISHKNTYGKYQCKKCSKIKEHNMYLDCIGNATSKYIKLTILILHILSDYAMGIIEECSGGCGTEIVYANRFNREISPKYDDLGRTVKRLRYPTKTLCDVCCSKKLRICRLCYKGDINHYSVGMDHHYCIGHPFCVKCQTRSRKSTFVLCNHCNENRICQKCDIYDGICELCLANQQKESIFDAIKSVSEIICITNNEINIIEMISEYAMGHIVKCCNSIDCGNNS